MATCEYPLKWPKGWNREGGRETSSFRTTMTKAHKMLVAEVQLMRGSNIIITTNNPLRVDGVMRMDRAPVDGGCAVYFTRDGKQMVFACDRYDELQDNIQAIAKTIAAMRGIERWGASSMLERAFAGFGMVAISVPAAMAEDWWAVLGVNRAAETEVVEAAYRALARKAHPDNGGSNQAMQRLTKARDQSRVERLVGV